MKISALTKLAKSVMNGSGMLNGVSNSTPAGSGMSFSQVKSNIVGGNDTHSQLIQVQQKVLNGQELSHKELLMYQIKASDFHLQVEMLSKLGEGVTASIKRFQQG